MAHEHDSPRPPERTILMLAVVTLTAYGSWVYTFGVLLDDLVTDLGSGEAVPLAAFGLAQLLAGLGSVGAGMVVDRRGSRPVFLIGVVGAVVQASSAAATGPIPFVVLFAVGAGTVGATGFYHVSQTAAARLSPGWETHAITRLTLYAAFSAPVFYPLTAWLVERGGWRLGLLVPACMTLVSFLMAAVVAASPPGDPMTARRPSLAGFTRPARRYALAVIISAGTIQLLSVYQVPVMAAAGLSLGTASALAGARGIAQFVGRLPLPRVVARVGAARSLLGAIVLLASGTALLAGSGSLPVAAAAMTLAGLAIGAQSPLVGIRGREVFEPGVLGTALGTVTLGSFLSGAVAPVAAGALVEATGSRLAAVGLGTVLAAAAAVVAGSGAGPAVSGARRR